MEGKKAGVRELKTNLSDYLRRVEEGEIITITKRGKTIGRIVPENASLEEKIQTLLKSGFLHWGGPFARTPKFRLKGREGHWKHTKYRAALDNALPGEIFIALYAGATVWQVYKLKQASFMSFSLIYLCGIMLVVGSILHLILLAKKH